MAENVKTLDEIMEGRFIRRVMQQEGQAIDKVQVKYIRGHNFKNPDWITMRRFKATENALEYAQKLKGRFVDMKRIRQGIGKNKTLKTKKNHPIYNKIMYGHLNNIIRELKFGYTDAVKEEMRKLEQ